MEWDNRELRRVDEISVMMAEATASPRASAPWQAAARRREPVSDPVASAFPKESGGPPAPARAGATAAAGRHRRRWPP